MASIIDKAGLPLQIDNSEDGESKVNVMSRHGAYFCDAVSAHNALDPIPGRIKSFALQVSYEPQARYTALHC